MVMVVVLAGLEDLGGVVGEGQGHVDHDGVVLVIVAGQVEGVVGAGHDLGLHAVHGEGAGVDFQLGVDVCVLGENEVPMLLGDWGVLVAAGESSSYDHFLNIFINACRIFDLKPIILICVTGKHGAYSRRILEQHPHFKVKDSEAFNQAIKSSEKCFALAGKIDQQQAGIKILETWRPKTQA